jgi:YfiH family protein
MMAIQHPVEVVRVPAWSRCSWLRHGFSTRQGGVTTVYRAGRDLAGDLNLGFTQHDLPEAVRENRRRFAEAVTGSPDLAVIAVRQVHGTAVKLITLDETGLADAHGRAVVEADGMITAAHGVLLGIQAADCVPVLVADTRQHIVAAFHAGWRGTVAGIVEKGIAQLHSQFGTRPEDLIAAVGPAIGASCYTVGDEVRERFHETYPYAPSLFRQLPTGLHLDLAEANRRQLVGSGLPADAVTVIAQCTACTRQPDGSRKYFSHRAEEGFTGRAMGLIGIL